MKSQSQRPLPSRPPAMPKRLQPAGPSPLEHTRSDSRKRQFPALESGSVSRYLEKASRGTSLERQPTAPNNLEQARYEFAARFVSAAIEGRNIATAGDIFQVHPLTHLLRHWLYRRGLQAVIVLHLLLPLWSCSFSWPMLTLRAVIVCIYMGDLVLHSLVFGCTVFWDKKWQGVFGLLVLVQLAMLAWSCGAYVGAGRGSACRILHYSEAVRPYLLISKMQPLRRVFTNVLRTMWSTREILCTGTVIMVFYAVLGVSLLNKDQVQGYSSRSDNFDSVMAALLSLFVLTTEENFPFVGDPAFTQRPRVAFPFFLSFVFVFMVVILPLMLGSVLDSYAANHTKQVAANRAKARRALLVAYCILDDDGVRGVSFTQFHKVLALVAPPVPSEQVDYIWMKLVEHGKASSLDAAVLRVQDFLELAKYLHKWKAVRHSPGYYECRAGVDAYVLDYGQWHFARVARATAAQVVAAQWFGALTQLNTLLLAALAVSWNPHDQSRLFDCSTPPPEPRVPPSAAECWVLSCMHTIEGLLLAIFAIEIGVRMLARGPALYFEMSRWNYFDAALALSSCIAYAATSLMAISSSSLRLQSSVVDLLELPRALRILRILSVFWQLRALCNSLQSVSHVVMQIMLLYCCVSYSFAIVGIGLFGGEQPTDLELNPRYSFDTFTNALLSMLVMTVTNNWNDLMYPLIVTRGRWSALFFVSYMLFCSTIMLDVLIGVVIEGFRVASGYEADRKRARTAASSRGLLSRASSSSSISSFSVPSAAPKSQSSSSTVPRDPALSPPQAYAKARLQQEDMFRRGLEEEGISEQEVGDLEATVKLIEHRLHKQWLESQPSAHVFAGATTASAPVTGHQPVSPTNGRHASGVSYGALSSP